MALVLPLMLLLILTVTLVPGVVLALMPGMTFGRRILLRGGGGGDRKRERRNDELHDVSPEKSFV